MSAREPYFTALTHPRYLRANFDAAAEAEFFASGEALVAEIHRVIRTHVLAQFAPESVLEYGCGVGRLVLPFARRALRVTGVDVDPEMLDVARERIPDNVELLTELEDARQFDLVNCHLVLQRLRRREGLALLRKLCNHVKPGGIGVFHFPYRNRAGAVKNAVRAARERVPGVNAAVNLVRGKSLPFVATTRMT